MSETTVTERCSCGATFTVTSNIIPTDSLERWRRTHRHEMPQHLDPAVPSWLKPPYVWRSSAGPETAVQA